MTTLENSFHSSQHTPTNYAHSLCQDLDGFDNKLETQFIDHLSRNDTQSQSQQDNTILQQNNIINPQQGSYKLQLLNQSLQQIQKQIQNKNITKTQFHSDQQIDDKSSQPTINTSIMSPKTQTNIKNQTKIAFNNKNQKQNQSQLIKSTLLPQPQSEDQQSEEISDVSPNSIIADQWSSQENFNISSKVSEYMTSVDNQSFALFLSIQQTTYKNIITKFDNIYKNLHNLLNQRIKNLQQIYLTFIKSKHSQQKKYLQNTLILPITNHYKLPSYSKTLYQKLKTVLHNEKTSHKIFQQYLKQITNKIQKYFQHIHLELNKKTKQINQIYLMINSSYNQIKFLMIHNHYKKNNYHNANTQIYSNRFLKTKYLMGKQKIYLSLTEKYLEKVLQFITYVCFQLQPKNCLTIKQCLLDYLDALKNFYPTSKTKTQKGVQALTKTQCYQQMLKQVCKLIQACIPQQYNEQLSMTKKNSIYNENYLKQMIQILINQSQSLQYNPVIKLSNKDFVYYSKNKANIKWIKFDYNQKYKSQCTEQFQTNAIITNQGYLVLQLINKKNKQEEKIAILKLKQIKIKRKNNTLVITDCKKGVIGYLVSTHKVLGSLLFGPINSNNSTTTTSQNALIDEFLQTVKKVMTKNKDKNSKKITNK